MAVKVHPEIGARDPGATSGTFAAMSGTG